MGLVGTLNGQATGGLQRVQDFGPNSSGTRMYIYVPQTLPQKPAIVVGVHYCGGTAQGYYNGSPYKNLADQKKFIVIYPESPYNGGCWDVSSKAALVRGKGADSESIANMVKYTISKYNADPKKVYAIGESSGAMMTVLMTSYLALKKRDQTLTNTVRISWQPRIQIFSPPLLSTQELP